MGKITCVKVNRREYEVMTARPGWGGGAAPVFLVTDGPGVAEVLRAGKSQCRFQLPRLAAVRNPIGAGDTVTAGVAHFLLEGFDAEEAFRRGLAMGSASCLVLEPAAFDAEAYLELLPQVKRTAHG
jgi:fructose-1-phosphate kinase PfkB-like protein